MLGGAVVVLAVGLAIIIATRIGRRRELKRRMAVREEIASILARDSRTAESVEPANASADTDPSIDLRDEATHRVRRSPMSPYMPDVRPRDTFIDLPSEDPVVDLTEDAVDLTEQRREARPDPRN